LQGIHLLQISNATGQVAGKVSFTATFNRYCTRGGSLNINDKTSDYLGSWVVRGMAQQSRRFDQYLKKPALLFTTELIL